MRPTLKADTAMKRALRSGAVGGSFAYFAPSTFSAQSLPEVLAKLHHAVSFDNQRDITLDFSRTTAAFEAGVVPLLPIISKYREKDRVKFTLKLPEAQRLRSIFLESNWAGHLDPDRFEMREARSDTHRPAIRFTTPKEQFDAVDKILGLVLTASDVDRSVLKAMEWSLNEITDNVLNHAGKNSSGFIQSTWFKNSRLIEFVVSDGGVGIAKSLRQNDHRVALEQSVQEGVTRNKSTNQGNGLFGSYRIAANSHGSFNIYSGFATLSLKDDGSFKISASKIPYRGTVVRWSMRTDSVDVLQKALVIGGRPVDTALDYMERVYEAAGGSFSISVKNKFVTLGSRTAGKSASTYIRNLLFNTDISSVTLDFSGVSVISSSFADEVFGKLFLELGPISFMGRVKFVNANAEVLAIIDRAIVQRSGMKS